LGKEDRKVSNYLIDKTLQLHYVLFVTVVSMFICGALGFLIWQQESVATDIIRQGLLEEGMVNQITSMQEHDLTLILTMGGAALLLILVLSFLLVIMTHKVAGPLYKVTLHLDRMRDGRLDTVWPLRDGDLLRNFFAKFMSMHRTLKARHVKCNTALKDFLVLVEASSERLDQESQEQIQALQTHCDARDLNLK